MPHYNSPIEYAHHFLQEAKGEFRTAEVAAWTEWENAGKHQNPNPFAAAAILIADASKDATHPLRALLR